MRKLYQIRALIACFEQTSNGMLSRDERNPRFSCSKTRRIGLEPLNIR